MDADAVLAVLADRQWGLVTHDQLLAAGLSRKQIAHLRRRRLLRALHRGVYALGHRALTRQAHDLAAVLACGPGALLSHHSAAVAWGMLPATDEPRHVTVVGRPCRSKPGLTVHRVTALAPGDLTRRDGIPVTSPARALIDMAATVGPRELERAFDEGRVQRLLTPATLEAALSRYPHRRGATRLHALLDPRRGSTRSRSNLEERFLTLLRRARLPLPEMNVQLGPFNVDFLWRAHRLVVELDSYRYHQTRSAFERDREKDLFLRARQLDVLRLTDGQLQDAPERALVRVAAELARREAA